MSDIIIKPSVKMRSLRFHKEAYEFQCDRSDNQHDMSMGRRKYTGQESRMGVKFFFFVPRSRNVTHDHNAVEYFESYFFKTDLSHLLSLVFVSLSLVFVHVLFSCFELLFLLVL